MAKRKQQSKMKKCARKWKGHSAKWRSTHSYRAFTKRCLRGRR